MNAEFPNLTDEEVRKLKSIEGNHTGEGVLPDLMNRAIGGGAAALAAAVAAQASADVLSVTTQTAGGAAIETMSFAGFDAALDTIVSVDLEDNGTNNVSLLGFTVNGSDLDIEFSADPGADAVVRLGFKTA